MQFESLMLRFWEDGSFPPKRVTWDYRRAAAVPKSCCMAWNIWIWDSTVGLSAKSYWHESTIVYIMSTDLAKKTKNDSSLSLHMSAMSAMSACKFATSVKRGNDLTTSLGKKHSPLHLNGTQIDGLTFSLMGACLCLRAWHSLRVFLVMRMKFVKKSLTCSIFLDKWWEYCEQIDASQSCVGICWHTMCEGTK